LGNRRKPENGAATAILKEKVRIWFNFDINTWVVHIPPVYVIQNCICTHLTMSGNEVLTNPGNKMIFEGSFDDLME
jgi:hypothetical protein